MTQDNITRFKILLQKFHDKKLNMTEEQLTISYEFVYERKFYPIKEKLAVRKSVIDTVFYLKDMANRDGYDTLDKIEHYFKRQRTRTSNMLRNLEKGK